MNFVTIETSRDLLQQLTSLAGLYIFVPTSKTQSTWFEIKPNLSEEMETNRVMNANIKTKKLTYKMQKKMKKTLIELI